MIPDFYRFLSEMNDQSQLVAPPQNLQQPQVGGNDQQPLGTETNLCIKGVDVHFNGHKLFVVQGENSFDLKLKPSQINDLMQKMQGMVQATGAADPQQQPFPPQSPA